MSLLVCIGYCGKDASRVEDLLLWCSQLGPQNHPCLLIADPDVDWRTAVRCVDLASKAFSSVDCVALERHVEGWTAGSVALFMRAGELAQERKTAWLWLEPDAVPVRAGWLDALESAYQRCGKQFMGPMVGHQTANLPSPYLEGVAVYPWNACSLMGPTITDQQSWVFSCARAVVPNAINTPLIQHLFGEKDNPPTFADVAVPGTAVHSLAYLYPDAVVFHRCKDGSLTRMLRKKHGIAEAPSVQPMPLNRPKSLRVVSLRRAGDIIALLPLLRHRAVKGHQVDLVVAQDFLPLMEGVSYVNPIPWTGDWESPLQAASVHKAVNAQVFGRGIKIPRKPANFVTEAWSKLNTPWNRYLPLDFDRRDKSREERLCASVFKTDKPKVLVKLHGFSSPFPHGGLVWNALRGMVDAVELVDMDAVKAERLYDLLGLMDRADCLISADTVTLHLNRSHRIPTIALTNGSQWGSSPRLGNTVLRLPYAEVPARMSHVIVAVNKCVERQGAGSIALVYSDWKIKDPQTRARHDSAFATWKTLGARLVPYVENEGRNSSCIGDPHRMPFLHEMIEKAMASGNEDIIAVTNNDIWLDARLQTAVRNSCSEYGCYWAHRLDREGGVTDNGVDFVAFTRKWWKLHKELLPDFIFGSIWWDDIISRLMIWSGCQEQARLYYHEPHPSAMTVRGKAPHMLHAERLARDWMAFYGDPHPKPVDILNSL